MTTIEQIVCEIEATSEVINDHLWYVNPQHIRQKLEGLIEKKESLADALLMMYEQYCADGHQFMSAGEAACTTLDIQEYASFDEVGRIIKITNSPH